MSQEKVDRYKQEKLNRKKNQVKEKVKRFFRRTVVSVLGAALLGWIGYSAYDIYVENRPKDSAKVNYTAITNYRDGLNAVVEE